MRLVEWLGGGGGGGHSREDGQGQEREGKHSRIDEREGKHSTDERREREETEGKHTIENKGKCKGKEEITERHTREERKEGQEEKCNEGEEKERKESRTHEREGKQSIKERIGEEREEKHSKREERRGKNEGEEIRQTHMNEKREEREQRERQQRGGKQIREEKGGKNRETDDREGKQGTEGEEREGKPIRREEIEEKHKEKEMRGGKQRENRENYKGLGGCGGKLLLVLLMVVFVAVTAQPNPFDEDDDELAFSLNRLYRDSKDAIDPHNMLPEPGGRRYTGRPRGMAWGPGEEDTEEAPPGSEGEEEKASGELKNCVGRLISLQKSLEEEQATSLKLQKMLAKEGVLDLQAFYRRAVQHLWNTLRLQEARDILKEGNTALVRQVSVRITQDNLEALDDYLRSKADPHKVDEFLQQGFTLETPPSESSPSLLQSAVTLGHAVIHAGKSLEVWLCMLCGGFVVLAMWAVVLFVRDIQRELRWGCVLGMMATVVFFICCLWHWRHMYKMAESRRHAELAKRGYTGIPEECQPGARSSAGNVYDWVKVNLFGSPDVCEKYFEQLMIDAIEEITPGMVIAETVSRFLFQPLQHLGTESAKLTTNFYKNVPPAYHLHATALFLGLLVVVLFYGCAYGIDFPLGLGGYRPMARQDSTWGGDRAGLGREAVEQLNRDREKFLEESRRMLTDIAKAAEGTKGPQQQLVVTSSGILEVQLERLISRHLDRAMEQQGGVPASPGVHTITSTPLRPQGTTKAVVQQSSPEQQSPEQQSPGLLSDFSSSSSSSSSSYSSKGQQGPVVVNERGDFQAMLAHTDAVHRRVAGTPAVRCLPPRTSSRSSSTNTSAASTPTASEAGSPSARRKKGSKFLRMFRSAEVPPSPKPSPSASTQSLSHGDLDEPDLGAPPDNSSFLAEVRSVLDLSTNSEHPSPPSSPSPPSQDWSTEDRQVSVSSPPP